LPSAGRALVGLKWMEPSAELEAAYPGYKSGASPSMLAWQKDRDEARQKCADDWGSSSTQREIWSGQG